MTDGCGDRTGIGRAGRSAAGALGAVGAAVFLAATALVSPANAIIGGTDATETYPFMVSLSDATGNHYCGGALVDPEWVLTAGHCTASGAAGITARIGSTDMSAGGTERGIAEIVTHPDYTGDPEDLRHDIALVRLDEPVGERPIGIAEPGGPGTSVRVMGWGMTCEDGSECPSLPETLQELDTEIVADDRCKAADAGSDICSEHPTEDAQMCIADSGGPMVQRSGGRWELVGVTSRDGDAWTDVRCVGPAVSTGTSAKADWINATINT